MGLFASFSCGGLGLPGLVATVASAPFSQVRSLGQEDPLEDAMATHFSILAWRISMDKEPGRLQSMGSHTWAEVLQVAQW